MTYTRRRLPHIDAVGRPVFITFRLHGSLPANRSFPAWNLTSGQAFVAMDRILDEARFGPLFLKEPAIAQCVLDSIERGVEWRYYSLQAWVIMANHVHLLLTPLIPNRKILSYLKGSSARACNLLLGSTGQPFWQDESFDRLVRSAEEFRKIRRYIENNPVRAGAVSKPEDYLWSSARRRETPPQAGGLPPNCL